MLMDIATMQRGEKTVREIIVEFPSPLTDKEKKVIYGYKGEVVRCKDCFHFWDGVCKAHIDVIYVDENDFCSFGERRED